METAPIYVIPLSAQKPKIISLVPQDPTSRYKTRQLQVQVIGKSKMIKTVLVNILDVAKDMKVPPSYIGTFMGYVIGAQAKWDANKAERQQAYISGEHDTKDLSKILLQFINEVILCPVCSLPEISVSFEEKKVFGKCRACGGNSPLPITNEKFVRYVANHPPTHGKGGAFGEVKVASKKDTNVKKESNKPLKSSKERKTNEEVAESGQDGVVWFSDTSEEAARKRKEEMVPRSIEEKHIETEVEELIKIIKDSPKDQVIEKLKQAKIVHEFNDKTFLERLWTAIFGSTNDLQAEVKTNEHIIRKFISNQDDQIFLLSFFDILCSTKNPSLAPKISLLLKDLYDMDLVEEESILKWYGGPISDLVKEKSGPFITWISSAEENSSEED